VNPKWISKVAHLTACLMICAATAASAQQAGLPWIGTWSAAPANETLPTLQSVNPGITFNNQSIRQYVFTSIGGSAGRIHLSNVYGDNPIVISDVHYGIPDVNGNIVVGSDVPVTFQGGTSVTIPAKGAVVSDAIKATIPGAGYVAISAYFTQTAAPLTMITTHVFAFQTNQAADGDVSGLAGLGASSYPGQYFFLTGLDVQNTNALGSVVALGASITDGMYSANNSRWPNDLSARLAAAGLQIGVLNQGISGDNLLTDSTLFYGDAEVNRLNRDVLSQPGVRWAIFSEFDDLAVPSPQLIAGLLSEIAQAHQNNLKVLCSTFTPVQATGAADQNRQDYNAFVRTPGNGCDAVIDQDAAVRDPNNPGFMLPQYLANVQDNTVHPSAAGDLAIANAIPLGIFSQPTPLAPLNPSTNCNSGITTGQTLAFETTLSSCDQRFYLGLQGDGNMVVYQGSNPLWASNTVGITPAQGEMLPTGNFVLYDAMGKPLWATNSDGNPGANLLMQDDGNLVIYGAQGPVWNSATCCH
jgi:hypothetical protein